MYRELGAGRSEGWRKAIEGITLADVVALVLSRYGSAELRRAVWAAFRVHAFYMGANKPGKVSNHIVGPTQFIPLTKCSD